MIFTTFSFTIFFLIFISFWWSIPKENVKLRKYVLIISSYIFYAFTGIQWIITLFITSLFTYLISKKIENSKNKKMWGIIGVLILVTQLVFWKYVPWAVLTWNELYFIPENLYITPPEFLFPIGLSFFTFHSLSLIIPVWKEDKKAYDLIDTLSHISFFPALLAGPVLRYSDINTRWDKKWSWKEVEWTKGLMRIMLGVTFKWVFASKCAEYSEVAFNGFAESNWDVVLGVNAYALQIFFDFAGYSHIAIGLAILMGWKLPENFTQPYLSSSIQDFWRNWHRSLSYFFRDNFYIHLLGGNKTSPKKALFNAFMTMLVSGLWHGANLTFILWGAFHGILLIIQNLFKKICHWKLNKILSWFITYQFVVLGWVLFKAENVTFALDVYKQLFDFNELFSSIGDIKINISIVFLFSLMWLIILLEKHFLSLFEKLNNYYEISQSNKLPNGIIYSIVIAFWSYLIINYGPIGVPDFIYNSF